MSARPGFTVTKIVGVDGGESPNAYVGKVTVEIRVHYPAQQIPAAARVLAAAIEDACKEMSDRAQAHVEAGGTL